MTERFAHCKFCGAHRIARLMHYHLRVCSKALAAEKNTDVA